MKKWRDKLEGWLLSVLPVVVFFSFTPVIRLGGDNTMNFELSLPLIWLAMFGTLSLSRLKRIYKRAARRLLIAGLALPSYATLSVFWSENPLRGLLTAGILWLIVLTVANILTMRLAKPRIRQLLQVHLYAGAVVAFICLLQDILDVFGAGREITQLCAGCTYHSFGFPHANGFAIEPQFMGNLLILPCAISLLFSYNDIISHKSKSVVVRDMVLSFWLIMSLYLCFSRGATYAFMLAVIYLLVVACVKLRHFYTLWLLPLISLAFSGALVLQGALAAISPTEEGFSQGVTRSINQMSLGIIDIERSSETLEATNRSEFDGYVPESTDVRLNLNELALRGWQLSPIFGVGLGGAGVALHAVEPEMSAKEIVQNEYLQILLELGIVGVVLVLWLAIETLRQLPKKYFLTAVIIAYLASWGFFSGLPNALHIYLLTPVLYLLEQKSRYVKIEK